jgi:hypothetical protein
LRPTFHLETVRTVIDCPVGLEQLVELGH